MGSLIEALSILPGVADSQHVEMGALESGSPLHALLRALPVAVYTTDAAGRITYYNEAAAELWGHRPILGKPEWCGSWLLRWPDGRPMRHDECPMAVALREGQPIRGAEAIAERPDGSLVPFLAYPTPLRDDAGTLIGAVNTLVDITERKRAELIAQRLAAIVESSDDAIVSKDLNGIIATWNAGAERLFGYTTEEAIGKPITMLIPPDRHDEEPEILRRIRRGERVDHYDTVRRRKDGSLVEISLTVSPIKDRDGRIIGASKIARDITERRQAQRQQNLLLREMNHRTKNLFALASGVVTLSTGSARTPDELARSVRGRLTALAKAHELTLPDLTGGATTVSRATTLHALLRVVLSPYVDLAAGQGERLVICGPDVAIGGNAVTGVALLLHELATNATKFGALSTPEGRIEVDGVVADDKLRLTWKERGGPPPDGPAQSEGFGSVLARNVVERQFCGQISRTWEADGLTVHLTLPMAGLAA